eukprot:g6918.t1
MGELDSKRGTMTLQISDMESGASHTRPPLHWLRPVKQSLNPAHLKFRRNEGESTATTQETFLLGVHRNRGTFPRPLATVFQHDRAWLGGIFSGFGDVDVMTAEEQLQISATTTVDQLFHKVKLRLICPPRWRKLFLAAGRRYELRLHRLQEAMFIGCAVDDLSDLEKEIPEQLWSWWAYELGLYQRAVSRCRPEMLKILPVIQGIAYPPQVVIEEIKKTMDLKPPEGSQDGITLRQHGELIIEAVRGVFEGAAGVFEGMFGTHQGIS